MSLTLLWETSKDEVLKKKLSQIISYAGTGELNDNSNTFEEWREFLKIIPSNIIKLYAEQCTKDPFPNSGLALQDIINEIGSRLDFRVSLGRYRSSAGKLNYNGLWESPHGKKIIIEVKTTDAYRLDLDKLNKYRKDYIKEYYYTTTFGSSIADGVYETLPDGLELKELNEALNREIEYYLFIDSHLTWWEMGKGYLCRIIDMLHSGFVDEVIFGKEVVNIVPEIVSGWIENNNK